jgi:ParB-like chromosome segregation protein Spo0J
VKTLLLVENVPLTALKLDPRNPRRHSEAQTSQIARSIKSFGFNVPILADENLNVLAGHGRADAAAQIGLRDVPVIRLAHLTELKSVLSALPIIA